MGKVIVGFLIFAAVLVAAWLVQAIAYWWTGVSG